MGGSLFRLGRLPRDQYLEIDSYVREYLTQKIGPEAFRVPRWYGSKPDFGDMDVVVCTDRLAAQWDEVRDEIARDLGVTRHRATGDLFSTVFRDFQVDFFSRGEDFFISTYTFLCFNDLGNILGKLFRRFNLKYGERGLSYVYRGRDDRWKREIPLTRDPTRIFGFLGLDPAVWVSGFDTLPDMFRWVVSSPFFTPQPFLNRTAATERRRRLRHTMAEFVHFLEQEVVPEYHFDPDRSVYISMIAAAFPEVGLDDAIRAADDEWERRARIRSRFNGDVVRSILPHLSGPDLGRFIAMLRRSRPDFDDHILNSTPEEVEATIRAAHTRLESDDKENV